MRDLGGGVKEHFPPSGPIERGPAVDPLAPPPRPMFPQRASVFTATGNPDSFPEPRRTL